MKCNDKEVAVINLQGRVFMNTLDDPFAKITEAVEEARKRTPIIFIDFHAEVTSEKQALSWYLDGKVISRCWNAYACPKQMTPRILPQGTAFLCDVGMTGPYNGILGMDRDIIITKFLNQLPARFEVAEDDEGQLSACLIDIDDKTGDGEIDSTDSHYARCTIF